MATNSNLDHMEKKRCPACAEEILAEAILCKHCGTTQKSKESKRSMSPKVVWVAISALVLLALSLTAYVVTSISANTPFDPIPLATLDEQPTPKSDSAWIPAGYFEMASGVAGKVVDHTIDCGDCGGLTYEVLSRDDCPSGLYVEANFVDAAGRVVDWSNDSIPQLKAFQPGLIEIFTYDDTPGLTISIANVRCS